MTDLKPDEIAQVVSSMVNGGGTRANREFIEKMSKEHRTLQQRFTQLCFDWLSHCDKLKDTGRYDGRNEASVKIAKKLTDYMDKEDLTSNRHYKLPFI